MIVESSLIKQHLEAGKSVRSRAVGRMGNVEGVWPDGSVEVRTHGGVGITRFDRGDSVVMVEREGEMLILNEDFQ